MFLLTSQLPGKSEDFLGHMSSQGCSRCKKSFSSVDGLDFNGFDRENWIPRTSNEHKHSAKRTLDETSYTAQQKLCSHLGARYSVLQEQDYWFLTVYVTLWWILCIISTLGQLNIWWRMCGLMTRMNSYLMRTLRESKNLLIQWQYPKILDAYLEKLLAAFQGFTADQWKNWTVVYSLFALKGVLPEDHPECWRHFVLACKLLGKKILTDDNIELGDRHLMEFCKKLRDCMAWIWWLPTCISMDTLKNAF